MSATDTLVPSPTYRIGTVSRLTGVPADTLRVWERRYGVVTPMRSDAGTRLYGPDDVTRLTLIKRLVDRGDAISSVANLSLDQLRERVRGTDLTSPPETCAQPCRVLVIGATLASRLKRVAAQLTGLDFVGFHDSFDMLRSSSPVSAGPDVVVLECPSLHADQVRQISARIAETGAARAILVYTYANQAALARLDARRILAKRAPVDPRDLQQWCSNQLIQVSQGASTCGDLDLSAPLPEHRFSDAELLRIATVSPSVRCECPHHLVDLVLSLNAFERYSAECEDRNSDDAALHAYLQTTTAHARAMMETALARVVDAEGIRSDLQADAAWEARLAAQPGTQPLDD